MFSSLRQTSSPRRKTHRPTNVGAGTGFREKLKANCLDEFRKRRAKAIRENRYVRKEMNLGDIVKGEHARLKENVNIEFGQMSNQEYESILLDIQNEIVEEERRNEHLLLQEQYEAQVGHLENDIVPHEDPNVVLCPVCQSNNLLQNRSVIFCRCGIRLDTKHDSLSLAQVGQQIMSACAAHGFVISSLFFFFPPPMALLLPASKFLVDKDAMKTLLFLFLIDLTFQVFIFIARPANLWI